MKRRKILILGSAALAAAAVPLAYFGAQPAFADATKVLDDERILGKVDAPITIIEYASLTCPHCANFHTQTLPTIKKNWIETGKARLVYRDYPIGALALRAAAVASCMEGDSYFGFVDALFKTQATWSRASDPVTALSQIARLAGMDEKTFQACFTNTAAMDRILQMQVEAQKAYDVNSTPSFVINGRVVRGALEAEDFEELLKEASS